MKSDDDDGTLFDEPTGEMPVVSSTDSRVTITGAEIAADAADETMIIDPTTLLPHWTDAPTGQVPIVVAREAARNDDPWAAIPAPAWREGEADWVAHEEQFDASILAGEERVDDARPWEFALNDVTEVKEEPEVEAPRPEPQRAQRTRHRALVEGRHDEQTWLGHREVRELLQGRVGAVVLDHQVLDNGRGRSAGANRGELGPGVLDHLRHAVTSVFHH